jgi:GcrA cell cycle regulator
MNRDNTPWPESLVAQLLQLHASGFSRGQIAKQMGLTRGAVVGKLTRLKAPQHPSIKNDGRHSLRRREKAAVVLPMPVTDVDPLHLKFSDLESHHCRWPHGYGPYTFCGHTKLIGSSYCPAHTQLASDPARRRRA